MENLYTDMRGRTYSKEASEFVVSLEGFPDFVFKDGALFSDYSGDDGEHTGMIVVSGDERADAGLYD